MNEVTSDDSPTEQPAPLPAQAPSIGQEEQWIWNWRDWAQAVPIQAPVNILRQAFYSLRHREFRLIWSGAMCSNTGTWVHNTAKQWVIFSLSGSAFWLGVDTMATQLPMVLLLPLGGVLADRMDRKKMLITINLFSAALAGLMAVLYFTDLLAIWNILLISVLMGSMMALTNPASQAMVSNSVPQQDIPNALALNAMQFNLSRALGPAIGGVVLRMLGAGWSFAANTTSFMFFIGMLRQLRPQPNSPKGQLSVWQNLKDGWRYLFSRPDLLAIESLVAIGAFGSAPVLTMLPALADELETGSSSVFAWLLSGFGAGAMLGVLILAARQRPVPRPWRAFITLTIFGLILISLGFRTSFWITLALVIGSGMALLGSLNRLFAAFMSSVPPSLRGRMSSVHLLFFSLALPIGSMSAGSLASGISIRVAFVVCGCLVLFSLPIVWLAMRLGKVTYQAHLAAGDGVS